MKWLPVILGLAVVLLLLTGLQDGPATPPDPPEAGTSKVVSAPSEAPPPRPEPDRSSFQVHGQVVDEAGLPLAGAALSTPDDGRVATSGADGTFAFDLDTPTGELLVTHPGTMGKRIEVTIRNARDVRVRLHRGKSLRGVVLRLPDRDPVPDAEVRIEAAPHHVPPVRTDAAGGFLVPVVPAGRPFSVIVDAGRSGWAERRGIVWTEGTSLEILVPPVRSVTGVVVEKTTGKGVPDVLVTAWVASSYGWYIERGHPQGVPDTSDQLGRFRIDGIHENGLVRIRSAGWAMVEPAEEFRLRVDGAPARLRIEVVPRKTGDDPHPASKRPEYPMAVHGVALAAGLARVVDEHGAPIASADYRVRLTRPSAASRVRRGRFDDFTPVGADGRFAWFVPQGEEWELTVTAPGFVKFSTLGTDQPESGERTVVLQRAHVAIGRLLAVDGTPLISVRIYSGSSRATTDLHGRFRLEFPEPGSYEVEPWLPGHSFAPPVMVQTGEDVIIQAVPPRGIKGRVRYPDGTPAVDADLEIRDESGYRGSARTGPDGRFDFIDLTGTVFSLTVNPLNPDFAVRPLTGISASTADLEITLVWGRTVRGEVLAPDGSPAAYVRVIAKPEDHAALDVEIVSDEDGKFLLEGLLPGSWSLHAWTEEGEDEFTAKTLGVRPGATDVRMRLSLAPEGE